jgi:putative oxidoreductase
MSALANLFRLSFLPTHADLGLLLLRLWLALPMLLLHGWGKLANFGARSATFADPFGIGSLPSLLLITASEVVGSVLIALGLFTRFAAVVGAIGMTVAFIYGHEARLTGPRSGELAFIFLGMYLVLLITGPGRFSVDGGARRRW